MQIKKVEAYEILDSRGNPTVQAKVTLKNGMEAIANTPSGASTGKYEAIELRDDDKKRYNGKGVLKAVENINKKIAPTLEGRNPIDQKLIDNLMIELDGTENKSVLGANAILAVSMAITRAGAISTGTPLYEYIGGLFGKKDTKYILPVPMINVLNGGKHAPGACDMQEFMIVPYGSKSVVESVRMGSEIFHALGKIIAEEGFMKTVGDEGGYAISGRNNVDSLEYIMKAFEVSGYEPYKQVGIAMDPASSEFFLKGKYYLKKEKKGFSGDELMSIYAEWTKKYPIVSLEDPFEQDAWDMYIKMNKKLGDNLQIVGDDFLVTNVKRLRKAIELKACNSILIKLNQIGTVSETIDAVKTAQNAGMTTVISHRSGETEDTFIADFAVGVGAGQIKTGSMSRSERVAKYNRLMSIERELGDSAIFVNPFKKYLSK